MKLKRALIRGLAVCLALTAVTATVQQQAIAASGPSVNAPDVSSVAVSNGSLSSRGPDEATSRALQGNQPAASNTPGGGSFGATPFSASASWEVSKQSGDFSWSYPLRVPPAPGGFVPSLGLSYRSSAVDGLTSATNNQPSWIGDGWDLSAGYIERSYGGCATDTEGGTTPPKTGDLCWRSDNASASFAGKNGMLIKDDQTGVWRLKQDDRSRVERKTTSGNGDRFNESWEITTVDGTKYLFGTRVDAKSTWTVPVFGDDAGEPCHESTFDASSCDRAWRWNLDKVVDPRGNVIIYNYEPEYNKYGKNLKDAAVLYVRAGTLKSIEYGLRDDVAASATGRVEFTLADRCVKDSECVLTKKENWPDAAVAENCDGTTCKDKYSPTFWSTKRLSTITAQVRKSDGYANVDRWTLQHEFPKTDDVYQAALWLKGIKHVGLVGGETELPDVTFEGTKKPNRVDTPTGIGPLNRYRVTGVVSEAGGVTQVKYANPDCVPGTSMPAAAESNALRCFPVKWAPPNGAEREDYFHKYVVESVTTSDRAASSAEQIVRYDYLDGAGWRRSQSEFTKDDKRTYSEFRGYGRVRVRSGHDGDPYGPVTMTEDRFYRGMHGDKLPNNGTRTAKVTDSEGLEREDSDWLSGLGFESQVHRGTSDDIESKAISTPTWAGPTATRGDYKAYWVGPQKATSYTSLRAGGRRVTQTELKHDDHGQVIEVNDLGDLAVESDDRCVTTSYVQDEARWRWSYSSQSETVSVRCGVTPSYPAHALGGARNTYDGASNLVKVETIDQRPASGPTWITSARTTYDVYGRIRTVTDALDKVTTTSYVPETGGPETGTVVTNALGHVITTTVEPAWGNPIKIVDANGNAGEATFDGLGRTTQVWRANRPREDYPDRPTQQITYDVKRDAPSSVSVSELAPNGNYLTSTTVFDGLYRERQNQVPTDGGRLIADVRYDTQGRTVRSTQPFFNDQPVDKNLLVFTETDVPGLTRTEFDSAGRVQNSIFMAGSQEKWRSTIAYGGDRVDVTPQQGATPTTTISDARGNTTELWQYKGSTASGDHDVTKYSYSTAGKLVSSVDTAGNTWRWEHDLRGRLTRSEDVDKGVSTMTYDALDRVQSITDARNTTLTYSYDALSRKTAVKSGATVLQSFSYDTASYGLGLPESSTRFVAGNAYTSKIKAYSSLNLPLSGETVIPDVEGPLKGTYKTSFTYKPDGSLANEGIGAITAATLPAETVVHEYDDFGRPRKTSAGLSGMGTDTLVNSSTYTRYGEIYRLELGVTGKRTWLSHYYDDSTRRMNRYIVDAEVASPKQADVSYSYDNTGNILNVEDSTVFGVDRQCFRYDHLRRLTNAWTPSGNCATDPATTPLTGPAPYGRSYEYDAVGNRTKEVQRDSSADKKTRTYGYTGAHNLASVTTAAVNGTRLDRFTYDAGGNTKTRDLAGTVQTLDWDVEGRVEKIAESVAKTTSFVYGTDGSRLIRRDPDGTTLYLGGQEVRLAKGATKPVVTRYYSHGNQVIAMREGTSKISWLANDHQGTAQIAVDRGTLAVERRRQLPFGEIRGGTAAFPGERGFVGGSIDSSTGLLQVGARQYDPAIGRFTSADPVMLSGDPQQWNAYAYSNNNPITFSDPSGLTYCDDHSCPGDKGHDYKCTNCPGAQSNQGTGTYDNGTTRTEFPSGNFINNVKMPSNSKTDIRTLASMADKRKLHWEKNNHKIVFPRDTITLLYGICRAHRDIALCDDAMFEGLLDLDNYYMRGGVGADDMLPSNNVPPGLDRQKVREVWGVGHGKVCPGNSFSGDTLVLMADGSTKRISEIEVGDRVLAADPASAESGSRDVVATIVGEGTKHLVEITVGEDRVIATDAHPFWLPELRAWVDAEDLEVGSVLQTATGARVKVSAVRQWEAEKRVFNLSVAGIHTYYVIAGDNSLLVHNQNAGTGPDLSNVAEWKGGDFPLGGSQDAGGPPNGMLKRVNNGVVTNYAVYNPAGVIMYRVDLTGAAHGKPPVPTPHVQSYDHHTNSKGEVYPKQQKIAVPAQPSDIPSKC